MKKKLLCVAILLLYINSEVIKKKDQIKNSFFNIKRMQGIGTCLCIKGFVLIRERFLVGKEIIVNPTSFTLLNFIPRDKCSIDYFVIFILFKFLKLFILSYCFKKNSSTIYTF